MSSIRRWHLPPKSILLGGSFLIICFFWLTHSYEPNLSSAARGGNWNTDSDDSTGLKPPYKGGAQSVGPGMIFPELPCRGLPGVADVVVVLKSDSTELAERFPVHAKTLLRCFPNFVVYADFDETFLDIEIKDIFKDSWNEDLLKNHPDLLLHRRVNQMVGWPGGPLFPVGRNALNNSERAGPISKPTFIKGKTEDIAGKMDKWKWLPMMKKTFHEHNDKNWFVFIETDTFIFWQTLLNYLSSLDHTNPYYIGGQSWIGENIFAHGGTGFAVSRAAMEKVVHNYDTYPKEWEEYTNTQWAGDAVLGKAFKNAGAPLLPAWPIFQGNSVGHMDYDHINEQKRLWCHPTVSYHGLSPWFVEDLWIFEMEWILRTRGNTKAIMTHRDVYREYILPRTKMPKTHWNNFAEEDQGPTDNVAMCLRLCFSDENCVQYRMSADMRCYISSKPNFGEPARGYESGWVHDRMRKYYDNQPPCGDEGFITEESSSG